MIAVEPSTLRDKSEQILAPLQSEALFRLYILFVVVHFLRFSSRIPVLGAIRITVLMFAVMAIGVILNWARVKARVTSESTKWLKALFIYIVVSLPLVKWPGSVLQITGEAWVLSVAFFFFTILAVDSVKRLRTFVFVVLACQIVRVIEPLYLHLTEGYWGSRTYIGGGEFMERLGGGPHDVVNPNGLAFIAVTVLPFLIYLFVTPPWIGKIWKLISIAIMGALIYTLLLTSSRSGLLALGVVVIAWVMKSRRKAMLAAAVTAACIAVAGSLSDLQRDRYLSIFSDNTRSSATAEARVQGLKDEISVAVQRPMFGHGLGTSGEAKYHFFGRYQVAHDLYTEVVIDLGFIGLIIFILFLRSIYRSIKELRRKVSTLREGSNRDNDYLRALADAVEVWGVMCLFVSLAYFGLMEWHWYLIAGIAVAAARVVPPPVRPEHRRAARPGSEHDKTKEARGARGSALARRRHQNVST